MFFIWHALGLLQSPGARHSITTVIHKHKVKVPDCLSPWSKSCPRDNSHGKDCFAIGSFRPKKISGLTHEMEGFNFCNTRFLNVFILEHVTETGRRIRVTLEKSLKLQILAPNLHKPSPHPEELYNRHLGSRFTASYWSPPAIHLKNQFLLPPKSRATKHGPNTPLWKHNHRLRAHRRYPHH